MEDEFNIKVQENMRDLPYWSNSYDRAYKTWKGINMEL
jgi:hypothetical protein